jgi:transcriptional regulator with XRE-family HTH domain
MNIKIANKLVELRKKNGLSQEELADKLGLSRQAVSKWERAESSPDTDNLICLAKLYGMSLDELLNTDESVEEIRERTIEVEEEKAKEKENDDEYIRIHKGHLASRKDHDKEFIKVTKHPVFMIVSSSVVALISTVLFLVFGFAFDVWYECWLFFLFIPLIASFFEAVIEKHAFTAFAYPILVTMVYVFLGFELEMWHPLWALFITIPVYYIIFDNIDKYVLKSKRIHDEDDED